MKKNMTAVLLASLALMWGCDNKGTEPETGGGEVLSEGPFRIEVSELHASTFKMTVKPADLSETYYCGAATMDYLSGFEVEGGMEATIANFIEKTVVSDTETPLKDRLEKGEYTRDVTGLKPQQEVVAFACHMDEDGKILSSISAVKVKTTEVMESDMTFDISIKNVTATSATLFISPSTDEPYVWMELPEDIYEGMSDEDIEAFLMKGYQAFFPSRSQTGDLAYSFRDNLDPETGYKVIVFGYDGGITTPLSSIEFRTLEPGNPEDVTFTFDYVSLTSHSTEIVITPTDISVAYLAIVVDEETLLKKGNADGEGVKKLIDSEIDLAIRFGEFKDRASFVADNAHRGVKSISFSLKPGMKHYLCMVCVDKEGEYASDVHMHSFDAPDETTTQASVTASFDKWFDGDALVALDASYEDEGYAGSAVLPVEFTLNEHAAAALWTVFATEELDGYDDEFIKSFMLEDYETTYFAEGRTDILLDWNVEYTLCMLASDEVENTSGLIKVALPVLTKEGASDVSEYTPAQ